MEFETHFSSIRCHLTIIFSVLDLCILFFIIFSRYEYSLDLLNCICMRSTFVQHEAINKCIRAVESTCIT